MSTRCLRDIRTLDDWAKQRRELSRQLLEMLGLSPLPARTPLKSNITGILDRETYRIEKVVFQRLPGLYVTGNFYVSNDSAKPLPTILYLCGHAPHPAWSQVQLLGRANSAGHPEFKSRRFLLLKTQPEACRLLS